MLSGHSAAQEIKHLWKFTSGFIGPQILNFERSLRLSPGPQNSLVPPCIISLGCPAAWTQMTDKTLSHKIIIGTLSHMHGNQIFVVTPDSTNCKGVYENTNTIISRPRWSLQIIISKYKRNTDLTANLTQYYDKFNSCKFIFVVGIITFVWCNMLFYIYVKHT